MGLIGCILYNNKAYDQVASIVKPEYFGGEVHGKIFAACGAMLQRGMPVDPITLAQIGGGAYLKGLLAATVTAINAAAYATQIRDLWMRRRVIDVAQQAIDAAYEFDIETSASDHIDALQTELTELSDIGGSTYRPIPLAEATNEALDRAADAESRGTGVNGIRTGYNALDRMLGGLQPGVYVLAGATSIGKTSCARAIAYNVATAAARGEDNAGPVLYFSMEMTAVQMGRAIIGPAAGVTTSELTVGNVGGPAAWDRLLGAQSEMGIPFFFDDRAGLTVADMHTAAKRLKRERGLGLIVADLLGYIKPPSGTERENSNGKIGAVMKALKAMAKMLETPVLLLHQLSRATEKSEDNRPRMSHLRDSGNIEQDADVVMFVYREHYYLVHDRPRQRDRESDDAFASREADWHEDCRRTENIAEIIVDKNRITGPIGTVKLLWNGRFATFQNLNEDATEQGRMAV